MSTTIDNLVSRRDVLKALASLAIACPAGTMHGQAESKPADAHRVLTSNILLDLPEQKRIGQDWKEVRRALCIKVLSSRMPDIMCLQEVGLGQHKDFKSAFPSFRSFGYEDPYIDTKPSRFKGIKNVIMFRHDRYELISGGIYWLSETPHIAGSTLTGTNLPRHVTWVRLMDKPSGREFRVLDTHFALEAPVRVRESEIILAEAAPYHNDFPQILAGDLNSAYESPEQKALQFAGWVDSYMTSYFGFKADGQTTGIRLGSDITIDRKIDYIYYRGKFKALRADIFTGAENGVRPSDHPFVSADFILI